MPPLNGFSTDRYLSGFARTQTSRNIVGLEMFARTFGLVQNEPPENKKKKPDECSVELSIRYTMRELH